MKVSFSLIRSETYLNNTKMWEKIVSYTCIDDSMGCKHRLSWNWRVEDWKPGKEYRDTRQAAGPEIYECEL